jgi:hypothetical protein
MKYDRLAKGKATSHIQHETLTDHLLIHARETVCAAEANGIDIYAMALQDRRAHLLAIFDANKLDEVLEMWSPVSGYVHFEIMYNCPEELPSPTSRS